MTARHETGRAARRTDGLSPTADRGAVVRMRRASFASQTDEQKLKFGEGGLSLRTFWGFI